MQMRKLFIVLALAAIMVSAAMLPQDKAHAMKQFNKLSKTRMGKNILTAIQLEMSSKNTANIVDKVVQLLQELLGQTEESLSSAEAELESKTALFTETSASYENQISSKKDSILQAQQQLPLLQGEKAADEAALVDQNDRVVRLTQDLADANDVNEKAVAAFNKSISNHNSMIDALTQASQLIQQLKVSSFLQKNSKVLAQISAHHKVSLPSIQTHHAKALFSVLMQMAQEVGTQSDQALVGSVLEVIEDLLNHEKEGVSQETDAENQRVQEYNDKVNQINNDLAVANEEIIRLEGEIVKLGNEIEVTNNNISEWSAQLENLEATLLALQNQYAVDKAALNDEIASLNDEIDTIKQAIVIFQGQALQDIKPLVDNLAQDE